MVYFELPEHVERILATLHQAGEEAYVVGGCVRDLMMGTQPHDYDITTSALPDTIKNLFRRTVDTGIEHGTVTVLMEDEAFEVTTYRVDGEYEDYRRPKTVAFSKELSEDLLRRDFTINAMAYNNVDGVVDLYDGQEDLKKGSIRCVGKARDRFNEDALRMMRAIRFSAQLGFDIEASTYQAIKENAALITHVSEERVFVELTKTLIAPEAERVRELVKTGLMARIIPEFLPNVAMPQTNPYHQYTVDEHIYHSLGYAPNDAVSRWTLFFHDIGKGYTRTVDENGRDHFYGHVEKSTELAKKVLTRLKADNRTIKRVTLLVRYHDVQLPATHAGIRRLIHKVGQDEFLNLMDIKYADMMAHSDYGRDLNISCIDKARKIFGEIIEADQCLSIKDLAVNGHDLIALGYKGTDIGTGLNIGLELVLENPDLNEPEVLLEEIRKKMVGQTNE